MKIIYKLNLFFLSFLIINIFATSSVMATDYYVSNSGNDGSNGTQSSPFKTFAKSISVLNPGDTLYINSGTYQSTLDISKSGTSGNPIKIKSVNSGQVVIDGQRSKNYVVRITGNYVEFEGSNIKVQGSNWAGIQISGSNILVDGMEVTDIESHGIVSEGKNITVRNTKIHNTVLENSSKNQGFGSALKVFMGGENIIYEKNEVFHNYGEGIATTRGKNITIRNNKVYDNFSVNVYIDNSVNVTVENNFITCGSDNAAREFYRSGNVAAGIALGEEYYEGWGNQLNNLVVKNNIIGYCGGLSYWGADSGSGGLRNAKILNNTFYATSSGPFSIESEPGTTNGEIAYNIFHSAINRQPWVEDEEITLHHNFWVGSMPVESARGDGDLSGDPDFVSTPNVSSPESYRLSSNSPAQGRGVDLSLFSQPPSPTDPPASNIKTGDVDQNGRVDIVDIGILIDNFRSTNPSNPRADVDGNGVVNIVDIGILIDNYDS